MSVSISDFWRLVVESRLLAPADCQRLDAEFAGVKGAASQSNASTLAEWLVAGGVLTHYHTRTLLTGKAGRFFYGDYYVYDRIRSKEGRLAGLLRAMHMPTRHPVMLYLITGPAAEDPQWWQVAVQQLAWACSVGHPFVAQCYQLLEVGRHKVVAIEDLLVNTAAGAERPDGAADNTLAARFSGGARLAPADACRVAYQVSLGLARLHQLGQVHGSVRPENIWLFFDGSAKLLQIPLAPKPATGPAPLDWAAADPNDQLMVAADYAAPELAQFGRPPDMSTDVYSLGATLYQMLSGWAPFPGGSVSTKLSRHAAEVPPPLEPVGVPQPVAQLVGYLLAKDPAGRYQTAMQAAEALAYFVEPAVASYLPPVLPTAAVFDQWLDGQPRVPGVAAGAIPTASSLAGYMAAQYAAAQNAEFQTGTLENETIHHEVQPPITQERGPIAATAPQQAAEQPSSFFESIQPDAPIFDPSSFAATEQARAAQQGFTDWDADAVGPTVSGAAVVETMPAGVATSASNPDELNLDALFDSAAESTRSRSQSRRKTGSAVPKARLSPALLAGLAGGLMVVVAFTGVILFRAFSGGASNGAPEVAIGTPAGDGSTAGGVTAANGNANTPGTSKSASGKSSGIGGAGSTSSSNDPSSALNKSSAVGSSGSQQTPIETVADDGISLWASPTAGNPLPLDYIANGAQLILAVRPANMLHRADSDSLFPSLGPWGDMAAHAIKDATGLELNQIDQILLVIHDAGDGKPVSTAIIRTTEKMAPEERLAAWGNPISTIDGDATYYQGQKLSYYLPAKEGGKLLVIGPAAQIKEIIHPADGPPTMPRALELILPHTDADRDVSLVFVPSYLFGDGQSVLSGPLVALRKPMEDFFGSDVGAAEFSVHFQTNFFLELRTIGVPGKDATTVSDDLAQRLKAIPTGVENDLDALNLHPYGRKLLRRLPEWMRLMTEYTRGGVEGDQPVLRCYLPSIAAPNLITAAELALAEQPVPGTAIAAQGPKKPQSIAEMLKKKTTLSFPRDTLERSLQLLFEDAGIQYEILGGDLQLEGITKNQSFGLDEQDKTVEEILQKIMRLANPDGKLVYVIKPKAPGGPEMLFITTRAAVAKRGDKLPPGLVNGPAKPTPTKKKS